VLTGLLPSCADFHETWAPQPPAAQSACPGPHVSSLNHGQTWAEPAACLHLRDFRFFEKLLVAQLLNTFTFCFMRGQSSAPPSKQLTTRSYPEPD
jgi:hypothetical protein